METLLYIHEDPINIIQRPLLASRYIRDIKQFVLLPANKKGPNIIVLSAHGKHEFIRKANKRKHRRILTAIDGEINISREMRKISNVLNSTIFILDACDIGEKISSFRKATNALGVIGFSKIVDWIDSTVFILVLLLKFQEKGIFRMGRISSARPFAVLKAMEKGLYKPLFKNLGVEYDFATRRFHVLYQGK